MTANEMSDQSYVTRIYPKAECIQRPGTGFFAIQAKTSDGWVWLGSAGTELASWRNAAHSIQDGNGMPGYAWISKSDLMALDAKNAEEEMQELQSSATLKP